MNPSNSQRGARFALTIGVTALFGGLWLFLNAMDVGVPPFKKLWPALFLLGAVASLVDFVWFSRRPSSAGWTVAWLGFGVLFFAITLGYTDLVKILDWLPSFPTILGLAFLTTFVVDSQRAQTGTNLLMAGLVLLGLGLMGFAARFDILKRILPSVQVIWAFLFLVGGGYLVWRTLRQKGS